MSEQNISSETIRVLLTGNSVYLRTIEGKEGHVYYHPSGMAYMQHFEHGLLTGPWQLHNDGYSVVWDKLGEVVWSLHYAPGEIAYHDKSGAKRATVTKIIVGDVEKLGD
ncbi:hypothetical protein [Maritalea sp.]|uniref:hypothetical protein n=1 Tax=Maritalea sp. TaxID=2003361 RepID=UPI003EF15CE3